MYFIHLATTLLRMVREQFQQTLLALVSYAAIHC